MHDTTATILIGYDGSDEAANAIRRAGELLPPRRAVVAYVWESLATLLLHSDVEQLTGSMREAADELDAEDAREAGLLAATLIDSVHSQEAAAVVVGSRGKVRVRRSSDGSVSRALVHHVPAPLLVVRPTA